MVCTYPQSFVSYLKPLAAASPLLKHYSSCKRQFFIIIGKYWELGIALIQELRGLNQFQLKTPYESLVSNLESELRRYLIIKEEEERRLIIPHRNNHPQELERQYYLNIRYKDRFFEEYFLVEYYGKGFPFFYQVLPLKFSLLIERTRDRRRIPSHLSSHD